MNESIREISDTIGIAVLGSVPTHGYHDHMRAATSESPSLSAAGLDHGSAADRCHATRRISKDGINAFLSALQLNCLLLNGIMLTASVLITFRLAPVRSAEHLDRRRLPDPVTSQAKPLDFSQSPAITEADVFSSTERLFMAIKSSGVSTVDTLFRVSAV